MDRPLDTGRGEGWCGGTQSPAVQRKSRCKDSMLHHGERLRPVHCKASMYAWCPQVEIKTTADTADVGNLQRAADFVHAFILGVLVSVSHCSFSTHLWSSFPALNGRSMQVCCGRLWARADDSAQQLSSAAHTGRRRLPPDALVCSCCDISRCAASCSSCSISGGAAWQQGLSCPSHRTLCLQALLSQHG